MICGSQEETEKNTKQTSISGHAAEEDEDSQLIEISFRARTILYYNNSQTKLKTKLTTSMDTVNLCKG